MSANEALDYVAGYCVCNDVSEREFQIERGGQWMKGKGCPTFGPLGPWMVTADEVGDVQNLAMWLDVNGKRMQTGSTKTMIFDCAQLVSYISHFMILEPGDIITTGTPPGVGLGMKPPQFLKAGDVVSLGDREARRAAPEVVAYDDAPPRSIQRQGGVARLSRLRERSTRPKPTGEGPARLSPPLRPSRKRETSSQPQHQLRVLHRGARRTLAEVVEAGDQERVAVRLVAKTRAPEGRCR